MYHAMLFLCAETILLNLLKRAGNFFRTNYFARVKLIKKQSEAPKQEH